MLIYRCYTRLKHTTHNHISLFLNFRFYAPDFYSLYLLILIFHADVFLGKFLAVLDNFKDLKTFGTQCQSVSQATRRRTPKLNILKNLLISGFTFPLYIHCIGISIVLVLISPLHRTSVPGTVIDWW